MRRQGPLLPAPLGPRPHGPGSSGEVTLPGRDAAPALGSFRNLLRAPRPEERFAIDGREPDLGDPRVGRLLAGLAQCMTQPQPSWPALLQSGIQRWENPLLPAGYGHVAELMAQDLLHPCQGLALQGDPAPRRIGLSSLGEAPAAGSAPGDGSTVTAQLAATLRLLRQAVADELNRAVPSATEKLAGQNRAVAHEIVTRVFHACIRGDLLKRTLHPSIYRRYALGCCLLDRDLSGMPAEFVHALGRYGRAMMRPAAAPATEVEPTELEQQLWLTAARAPHRLPQARRFLLSWSRWFELLASAPPIPAARLSPQLLRLGSAPAPGATALIERDLRHGAAAGLWSVWGLRREIEQRAPGTTGLSALLSEPDQARWRIREFLAPLAAGAGLDQDDIAIIAQDPPLYFFVLFEAAQAPEDGQRLGVLGSVVVAEVVFAALAAAGRLSIRDVVRQAYGGSSAKLDALAERISAIETIPDLIRFVAQEADLAAADPRLV